MDRTRAWVVPMPRPPLTVVAVAYEDDGHEKEEAEPMEQHTI